MFREKLQGIRQCPFGEQQNMIDCQTSNIIQSLWIGDRLSNLQRMCINSFLYHDHEFHLYTYKDFNNLPKKVVLKDANEILPESTVFTYEKGSGKGSPSCFANLFRYKLLYEKGGWWVDLDMVCLKRFDFDSALVFGKESRKYVCNAVLHAPEHSEFMHDLYDRASKFDGSAKWGTTGPKLLTSLIREYGFEEAAKPVDYFYPVSYKKVESLLKPRRLKWLPKKTSYGIHLSNAVLCSVLENRDLCSDSLFPDSSILGILQRRYLFNYDE